MHSITPKKAKTSHAKDVSPAQAILSSPPAEGFRAFYYQPTADKTTGYTPGKGHTVPLGPHEGRSHHRVGSDTTTGPILSSPGLSFFDAGHSQATLDKIKLLAKLKNLKSRADTDYRHKQRDGLVDPDHLTTAKQKISRAILLLKKIESVDLIKEINKGIGQGGLYNPYGLRVIYYTSDYDLALADSGVLYQPISVPAIKPTKKRVLPQISSFSHLYDDLPAPAEMVAPDLTSEWNEDSLSASQFSR